MFDKVYFDQIPFDGRAFIAPPLLVTRVIHVRHPALLTVIQKRDGRIVRRYDTLSSLDDRYLTTQVGLDVAPGDLIKATTLPGKEYSFKVT